MTSLLDEIASSNDAKITRAETSQFGSSTNRYRFKPPARQTGSSSSREKYCPLCKQAGRPSQHFLSECKVLPDKDRKYIARARQIAAIFEADTDGDDERLTDDIPFAEPDQPTQTMRLVQVRQSPYFDAFHNHHTVRITVDSGATCNMIRLSTVKRLETTIEASSQSAHQADGYSPLEIIGEREAIFMRDGISSTSKG